MEWFLYATICGYVPYTREKSYPIVARYFNELAEHEELDWKCEEQIVNRYENVEIGVSTKEIKVFFGIGILLLALSLVFELNREKTKVTNIDTIKRQLKEIFFKLIEIISNYIIVVLLLNIFYRNSIFCENLMEEKAIVSAIIILYGAINCIYILKCTVQRRKI
ncbi:MAG: hypothetical protein ACI4E3_08095 [Candidatus Fimousia sp.]